MQDVNITRAIGQLKRTEPTDDAVVVMVFSGAAVGGTLALLTRYQIFSTDDLVALGLTLANNPVAYQDIQDFYRVAGQGAELNFMLVVNTTTLKNICDNTQNIGKKLLDAIDGRAVIFLANVKRDVAYVPVIVAGLDKDVSDAYANLNVMAKAYDDMNTPFVGILPALGFTKATMANIVLRSTLTNDYVALNTWCNAADGIVSQGQLAGWIVKHQVHQNIGRVKSGAVSNTAFMPDSTPATDYKYNWDALAACGLLLPVKRGAKSGYFFKDDPTLTAISSDYSSISWNRTMNKAKRIAYNILLEKVNENIDINPGTGLMETSLASDWEGDVEQAIIAQMMKATVNKSLEISAVKCQIDPNSDVVNDKLDATLTIVRQAQAKTINVKIGYGVTA
jgi:hypothetical protein